MQGINKLFKKAVNPLDTLLGKITMYRLVLYILIVFTLFASAFSALNKVPFEWYQIVISASWLVTICWLTGNTFSWIFKVPRNKESDYITGLILSLIFSPANSKHDFLILAAAGFIASASKYIIAPFRRHVFNPAAFGAFTVGILLNEYPSWWVGTKYMLPIVIIGGWLILRKTNRFILDTIFIATVFLIVIVQALSGSSITDMLNLLWLTISATPLLFFAYIMVVEPLTSPPGKIKYIPYALLVAILYSVNKFGLNPQEALLIGNVYAYLVCHDRRYRLKLKEKRLIAKDIIEFNFHSKDQIDYKPGQYMHWTIPIRKVDSRGNRRFFTISSSPTENVISLTTKFSEPSSAFKQKLNNYDKNDSLVGASISGSFTLPDKTTQKITLIAGGIGVTPFRSMAKYMVDKKLSYDAILLYVAADPEEFAFKELFKQAYRNGFKTNYIITNKDLIPKNWNGFRGTLNQEIIKKVVPDYKERLFYISGPRGMVIAIETELQNLGVKNSNIKTDYFPGY